MKTENMFRIASLTLALLPFTVARTGAQDAPPPPAAPGVLLAQDDSGPKQKAPPPPDEPGSPRRRERVEVRAGNGPDGPFVNQFGGGGAMGGGGSINFNRNFDQVFTFTGGGPERDQPLIVSTGNLDETVLANLEEDLSIMSRILEKASSRGGKDDSPDRQAMGIHLWALGQGHGARNLYIDGYGALFQLNANIPLVGAPAREKEKDDDRKEPSNSTWDSARKELFGGQPGADDDRKPRGDRDPVRGPRFDPNRVDALKENLIEALKNASHIRGLNQDDYVTVVVQGAGSGRGGSFYRRTDRAPGQNNFGGGGGGRSFGSSGGGGGFGGFGGGGVGGGGQFFAFSGGGEGPGGNHAVMVLRAKKSDIDAAAKGKSDDDKFRKSVSVKIYQNGGEREQKPR